MTLCKFGFLVLGLLAAAAWCRSPAARTSEHSTLQAEPGDKAEPGKLEKKHKPKFTISKETTYVTGPLRKDGTIDYAAALNQRLSQGVTPDNNANVLFWKAFGPHPEGATMPPEFFKWLGYQPPERGEYFGDLHRYLKEHLKGDPDKQAKEIDDLFERVTERPWTAKQYPQVAAYLKANEKPLALVVEGTKRSRYFSPLVPKGDAGLVGALSSPGVQKCREFANALAVRAMLHIGEGSYDDAWQDLLACHRLGRLLSCGSTLIEQLVGTAVDVIASQADLAYLDRAQLNAKQALDRLRDLQRLAPMPAIADKVDLGERFMFLDCVMLVARGGPQTLGRLAGARPKAPRSKEQEAQAVIDWDPALLTANRWFNRLVNTMRLKGRRERSNQLDQIERDLKKLKNTLGGSDFVARALLSEGVTPKARGKMLGELLICELLPAVGKVQTSRDEHEQIQRNLYVAFALAAYRAEQGRYPMKLEALAPRYLAQVPNDLFSGKPLIYRPTAKGYLLYSVGVNGQDDQGRSYDDDPPGDDLRVRMPVPELRRK
jgi:hypothetical protein